MESHLVSIAGLTILTRHNHVKRLFDSCFCREVDLDQAGREMTKREVCDGGKVCTSSVCTSWRVQKKLELICPSGKSPQVIKARYGYWSGSYANAALGKYKCKFIPEETSCTVDVKFNTNGKSQS